MSAMLRAPLKRGKILQYNRQDLENAVKAVEAGDSIRQASVKYGIPRSTIGDRISGRFDIKEPVVHGRPPAIPFAVENKIVASVKMAAKMGVGLSRKQILTRTYILCKRIKMQTSYPNFKAGKDWWEGVKRRHPEITLRKPEKLSTVRARMLNPVVVENYFNDLERVISELGVSETEIWNCDETGLNFEHNPPRVVTERGANSVVGKTSQKSSNLTIMACVNGGGSVMPPLVITKGKTVKSLHGFKTSDAPVGTVWSFQEKGWITDEIGEKWFDDVFLKHCGPKRPQLLIFDGHSSHETLAIIERAIGENIALLSLPPHCTHYLQPLDRSVFGPFKKSYNEHCSDFMSEHPLHVVNKWTFPSLLMKAWQCSFTEANIRSGFASCGICPVNRAAVPASAFAPSASTDIPAVNVTSAAETTVIPLASQSPQAEMQTDVPLRTLTPPAVPRAIQTPLAETASSLVTQTSPVVISLADVSSAQHALPMGPSCQGDTDQQPTNLAIPMETSCHGDLDQQLTNLAIPVETNCHGDLDQQPINLSIPVLDISDPAELLQLIATGDLFTETVDESAVGTIEKSNVSASTVGTIDQSNISEAVNDVFLPPKIESRSNKSKVLKKTSHTILTSEDILEQKRQLEIRKNDKQAKKAKRVKKEKV